tara:strand:+ start:245 stop:436 length:192 start_codon:yes stop_codon:yes gene_type:complete
MTQWPRKGIGKAVKANKEKGFFNHSANAVSSDGPIYYIWIKKKEVRLKSFRNSWIVQQARNLV